ncbi:MULTISPECIES: hypothetical protein [unclassified Halomonas]|uniref:hypothetical protein n=1 Tax=unclassified Halomonas TaxID=2609666 RepID=UPI002076BC50|nr:MULTISPECIES: hypothetical protein [unclassified Halomonas]
MFASIKAQQFAEFYVRVYEQPVLGLDNADVYELVKSSVPNDIIKNVNHRPVAIYRHVALDKNGIGYLFDFDAKQADGCLGPCELILDSEKT